MRRKLGYSCLLLLTFSSALLISCTEVHSTEEEKDSTVTTKSAIVPPVIKDEAVKVADTAAYERTSRELADNDSTSKSSVKALDTAAYNRINRELANNDNTGKWPVKAPYPLPGAVLPYNRIVAFYGNLYSKRMGILGELPKKEMLKKLKSEVAKWQAVDTSIPVIPALHYIAVTAQGSGGRDGKYRLRMPFHQIDTIINWSKEID